MFDEADNGEEVLNGAVVDHDPNETLANMNEDNQAWFQYAEGVELQSPG